MSENYMMIDGKRIKLPDEIVNDLKKQFGIKPPRKGFQVDTFAAFQRYEHNKGCAFRLGITFDRNNLENLTDEADWNNNQTCSGSFVFSKLEVEQIIAGLRQLIEE